MFTLARFSEAFLILRAQAVGLPLVLVPVVLVLMNVVYAFAAYPAGVLSDHARPHHRSWHGLGIPGLPPTLFSRSRPAIAGVASAWHLWGLHMGFTQGLLATLVADTAPPELRGTAYGMFNLLGGLALLVASVLAGALWDSVGSQATFLAGAAFTAIALARSCRHPTYCARRWSRTEVSIGRAVAHSPGCSARRRDGEAADGAEQDHPCYRCSVGRDRDLDGAALDAGAHPAIPTFQSVLNGRANILLRHDQGIIGNRGFSRPFQIRRSPSFAWPRSPSTATWHECSIRLTFARRVFACDLSARDVPSEHDATSKFGPAETATCVPSGRGVVSEKYMRRIKRVRIRQAIVVGSFPPIGPAASAAFRRWLKPCHMIGRTVVLDLICSRPLGVPMLAPIRNPARVGA